MATMTAPVRSRSFQMTQETIDAWALLSGDRNPLHTDPAYAEQSRFGGTICHGHFTIALMLLLMRDIAGDAWLRGGLLSELQFTSPVRPGCSYVLSAEQADDSVSWLLELRDEETDTLAVVGRASIATAQAWP
jgi:acyl dehydratase